MNVESRGARVVVRASADENFGSAADAGGNSIVLEVAALPEEPQTEGIGNVATTTSSSRKPSPLARGGTLDGAQAEGKAPAAATLGKVSPLVSSGKFEDPRWKNGTWDLSQFTTDGKTDWDAIIDAGMLNSRFACGSSFWFRWIAETRVLFGVRILSFRNPLCVVKVL